jgi:hypothetical protein
MKNEIKKQSKIIIEQKCKIDELIYELKQINVLQDTELKNKKLEEIIINQQDEISLLKITQVPTITDEYDECVYLLLEREFINSPFKIAKIGRSKCFRNRMGKYPKNSKLLCVNKCNNSVKAETDLLYIFNNMFKHRKDIGYEYFEGDVNIMIKQINGYFYNI